ncbi:hypothetical protein ACXWR7_13820, partial [Streptococcus pyogenes]
MKNSKDILTNALSSFSSPSLLSFSFFPPFSFFFSPLPSSFPPSFFFFFSFPPSFSSSSPFLFLLFSSFFFL